MTNYNGLDYDQLVAHLRSGDPTALRRAAEDWKQAARAADEVTGTLSPKAQQLKPSYRGVDGTAYGENLDTLSGFAKQLNADAQDAYEGMLNAATALHQAQTEAAPIIAEVEAASGARKEKLKKQAAKQLAAIMTRLASAYQDTIDKKWHDPAPGPKNAKDPGTERVQVWNATPDADETPTDITADPYSPLPSTPPLTTSPHTPAPDLLGGGLAGNSPTTAPTLPAGPIGAAPMAATASATPPQPPPLIGGGLAAATGGATPTPTPKPTPKQPAPRTPSAPSPLTTATPRDEDHDERGEHTWLTEDEIPWTTDASAPVVIGEQGGYR